MIVALFEGMVRKTDKGWEVGVGLVGMGEVSMKEGWEAVSCCWAPGLGGLRGRIWWPWRESCWWYCGWWLPWGWW